jgi:hypothetical protein
MRPARVRLPTALRHARPPLRTTFARRYSTPALGTPLAAVINDPKRTLLAPAGPTLAQSTPLGTSAHDRAHSATAKRVAG